MSTWPISVNGVVYAVLQYTSRDEMVERHPHTAAHFAAAGILGTAVLQRPRGRKLYMAHDYGQDRWRVFTQHGV